MATYANKVSRKQLQSMELPTVTFSTQELMARVGFWSGVIYENQVKDYSDKRLYANMDHPNPLIRIWFPPFEVRAIKLEFQYVLLCAGIDKDEECYLSDLDQKNFTFNCHLKKANKDVKISMRWETIDDLAQITLEDDEKIASFDHLFYRNEKVSEVIPGDYTLKKGDKSCFRFMSGRYAEYTLSDKDGHSLKIHVERPDWITEPIYDYQYHLDHEKELEEYLLGLSFPIDISEVYKKLISISLGKASDYPGINLEVKKGKDTLTDKILLSYGNLVDFMITRDGKRVHIDKDGNWSFDTDSISVNQSTDGSVGYSIHADSYDTLLESLSNNHFVTAKEEVEGIKEYSKTLFNPPVNN